MKTLSDEMLEILAPEPMPLAMLARMLGADAGSVRRSAQSLNDSARAVLVRRRRALHLASAAFEGLACKKCYAEFDRAPKSKRQCCSRACGIAWSWTRPGVRDRRVGGIVADRATPAAKARLAAHNKRRWSKPGERERLAELSRERWADPAQAAKMAAGIRAALGSKEMRALYSEIRKAFWDDPEGRDRMIAGIRKSKQTPEARAKFSKLLRDRWADPEGRKIHLAGVRKTALKMSERNRGKKQTPEQISKRVASTKLVKARKIAQPTETETAA